ncbi:NADH-quinone oxidoreductase subunit NuoF [Buchnera aphidicola]|uniref:NADH-quinone oxidoreductase subunit F n=1 Tax=Buchnera aphidicola (Stegophylla sp.) TaxID=2315800 RepID=A0A4D6YMP2_9GAMM|nr:NADH oxidoreductase (quinone) subunit F [Buchnera aphidicola (Stegophylla sp.)]
MKKIFKKPESHPLTWWLDNEENTVYINEYCQKNGYSALKMVLKNLEKKEIIDIVKCSELKGRGGAGFYTGVKWSLMPKKEIGIPRYLICNADEMEPGTFKDRFLLEKIPHQLIEGIIIASFALDISRAYIFLRGEYIDAERILKRSISEAKQFGYLGNNILKSDFSLDIIVHTGAGRYICGEETALINSLEGRRANPRIKPPFPACVGLWGKPTCVNNVETLSNIPSILLHGVDWYKSLSCSKDQGTKLMGFSGQVNYPGLWELPFGISAREILEDYSGGMKKGLLLKAWQPGGASTDFLIGDNIDVKMDFESIFQAGSRFGTGIGMVVDHTVNIVSLVCNLEEFFARESCGFCTPCRDGLPWIVKILRSMVNKSGRQGDIEILEDLCIQLGPGKTVCAHAPGAIEPLQSAIKLFRSEFEDGIDVQNSKNILDVSPNIQSNMFKLDF